MNVLINHCWCSDSNWGGQYNCRVIVSLKRFAELEDVYKRKQTPDWEKLVDEVPYDNGKEIPFRKYSTFRLKPEVIQWLKDNVKDRKLLKWQIEDGGYPPQCWAVGSDEYNSTESIGFSIFFQNPTDARKFIKHWSIHKNPEDYLNYFHDRRWKLDPTTGKMKRAPR